MKEKPILFSTEMIRAILDGRKTQTRRVIKPQFSKLFHIVNRTAILTNRIFRKSNQFIYCPYGKVGNRLWVRETWRKRYSDASIENKEDGIQYKADGLVFIQPLWKPSIHMPRWASRITLEITNIRVERVQEISEDDAQAEGCGIYPEYNSMRYTFLYSEGEVSSANFRILWDSINAKRGYPWKSNPYVWVIEFKKL